MKKFILSFILLSIPFILIASDNANSGSIEGKWQPYDISISMEGVPSAILSAIAIQMKDDPSAECVKNSIIEVKKDHTYSLTNACEEGGNMSGTWKLNGNKLTLTVSKYPDSNETVVVKSITEDLITVDVTDKIPNDFEFNGVKPTLLLILKKM